jgi:CubicO group peptidase (beta-lactamase class C family)
MLSDEDAKLAGVDGQRLDRVIHRIRKDIAEERYDGVRLLASRRGKVILNLCEGFASREGSRPLGENDVFHVFSISKMLTAVLALKLIEAGLFRLTTPIADVIPEFGAASKRAINVYHILTHTSGLPRDTPGVSPAAIGILSEFAG